MVFNQVDGIYTYAYEASRNEGCMACNQKPKPLEVDEDFKLQDVIDVLTEPNGRYQMKNPGLTTTLDGKNKTLYMSNIPSIEQATRPNLKKTLRDLGMGFGSELVVADVTSPNAVVFKLVSKSQ